MTSYRYTLVGSNGPLVSRNLRTDYTPASVDEAQNRCRINTKPLIPGSKLDHLVTYLNPPILTFDDCRVVVTEASEDEPSETLTIGKIRGSLFLWFKKYGFTKFEVFLNQSILNQNECAFEFDDVTFFVAYRYHDLQSESIAFEGYLSIVDDDLHRRCTYLRLLDPVIIYKPSERLDQMDVRYLTSYLNQLRLPPILGLDPIVDVDRDHTAIVFSPGSAYGFFSMLAVQLQPINLVNGDLVITRSRFEINRWSIHTGINQTDSDILDKEFIYQVFGEIELQTVFQLYKYSFSMRIQNVPSQKIYLDSVKDLIPLLGLIYPTQLRLLIDIDPHCQIETPLHSPTVAIEIDSVTGSVICMITPIWVKIHLLHSVEITLYTRAFLPQSLERIVHEGKIPIENLLPPGLMVRSLSGMQLTQVQLSAVAGGMYTVVGNLENEIPIPGSNVRIGQLQVLAEKNFDGLSCKVIGRLIFGPRNTDKISISWTDHNKWALQTEVVEIPVSRMPAIVPEDLSKELIDRGILSSPDKVRLSVNLSALTIQIQVEIESMGRQTKIRYDSSQFRQG